MNTKKKIISNIIEDKKTLSIKEYKKIMNEEIEKYKTFIKEMEEEYVDFDKIKHYFHMDALPYLQYCELNEYKPELTDEQIKNLMKKQ